MSIETILKYKGKEVVTTGPATGVKQAAELMHQKNIAALLVVEGQMIRGIVTERDIVRALVRYGADLLSKPVSEIMTEKLITGSPDDSVKHVMAVMTRHHIRHFPVLRNGRLEGLISIGDVVRNRVDELELEANVLRDAYIAAR
jgi:CBS domain-containing protein